MYLKRVTDMQTTKTKRYLVGMYNSIRRHVMYKNDNSGGVVGWGTFFSL